MSLFQNIKSSIKSLTTWEKTPGSVERQPSIHVDYDVGADLLHKYQVTWKEAHQYTEETGKRAEAVDAAISELFVKYSKQSDALTRLHEQVSFLPVLLTKLQEITDVLAQVEEDYDRVEAGLIQLENLCEEQELARSKQSHTLQLQQYKKKRLQEVEKTKVQLAKEHTQRIEAFNRQKQAQARVQQAQLEKAIHEDLEYFKIHGRARTTSTSSSAEKVDVLDIPIDEDKEALEEFLEIDVPVVQDSDTPVNEIIPSLTHLSMSDEEEEQTSEGETTPSGQEKITNSEAISSPADERGKESERKDSKLTDSEVKDDSGNKADVS